MANTAAIARSVALRLNLAELPSGSMVNVPHTLREMSCGACRRERGAEASALPLCV